MRAWSLGNCSVRGFARSWACGARWSWRWTGPTLTPTITPRSRCTSSPATEGPRRSSGSPLNAHDLANPRTEQFPRDHARIAQQPIDLFDGGLGEQSTRLRERLPDHGNRKRRPSHDPERSIGQREDALGVHVVDEDAVQEFMNKIKSLLRRAHTSPSRLILHPAKRRLSNSGPFESRENE